MYHFNMFSVNKSVLIIFGIRVVIFVMKLSFKFLNDWVESWRQYVAEFIGTLIFVFTVSSIAVMEPLYGGIGRAGEAMAIGLIYTYLIYATANISGGFLNPAITISLWLCQKITGAKAFFYITAQILASICAVLLVSLIFGNYAKALSYGMPSLGIGVNMESAMALEAILTASLVFVVFATNIDKRKFEGFGPLALGLMIGVYTLIFLPMTGAVLNIARVVGIMFFAKSYSLLFVYIIGGLVGSLFGLVYELVFLKKDKKK